MPELQQALDQSAAYAASGLPPYAGPAKNRFDPSISAYNAKASNLRKSRAAIGKAASGNALAHIAILGDSLSDQFNGSNVPNGGYDITFTKWPWQLRKLLVSNLGIPQGGTGFVKCYHAGVYDPRWTLTGSWTNTVSGPYSYTGTANDTATFSTTATGETGTTVSVTFPDYQSTTWTISVDGASSGAGFLSVTNGNNGTTLRTVTLTGLPNTTHSVVIKNLTASFLFITGASLSGASGLVVDNYAIDGGLTGHYISGGGLDPVVQKVTPSPDLIICPLGINDMNSGGLTGAQVVTNLTAIRNRYPSSDFIAVLETQSSVFADATWLGFARLLYGMADSLDVPLVDQRDRFGTNAQMTANGLMFDGTHQNASGDIEWAYPFVSLLSK